jgi:membrane protease YdiL (CAAX protease family)
VSDISFGAVSDVDADAGARALARRLAWVGVVLFWLALGVLVLMAHVAVIDAILLSVLLVAVPTMSIAQLPLIKGAVIERIPAYWSSIASLWLIGTACWFVGTRERGAAALGLVGLPLPSLVGWTVGLTGAALAVIGLFHWLGSRFGSPDTTLLRQLLPETREEKGIFLLLSVAAGSGEEVAYRGYVIPMLAPLFGLTGAVVVSTAVFGIMHGYQGTMGILRTTLMGGVLAGGFLASGSLWPPILAHTLIDMLAGVVLGERLLVRETE